jgi:hypothetical protein
MPSGHIMPQKWSCVFCGRRNRNSSGAKTRRYRNKYLMDKLFLRYHRLLSCFWENWLPARGDEGSSPFGSHSGFVQS